MAMQLIYEHKFYDTLSEWLRRWTRNPLGSARRGSNPLAVDCLGWVKHHKRSVCLRLCTATRKVLFVSGFCSASPCRGGGAGVSRKEIARQWMHLGGVGGARGMG